MKYDAFLKNVESHAVEFTEHRFENEFGERFVVLDVGTVGSVVFTGDETDWQIFELFASSFSIWSADELRHLGESLIAIAEDRERAALARGGVPRSS